MRVALSPEQLIDAVSLYCKRKRIIDPKLEEFEIEIVISDTSDYTGKPVEFSGKISKSRVDKV